MMSDDDLKRLAVEVAKVLERSNVRRQDSPLSGTRTIHDSMDTINSGAVPMRWDRGAFHMDHYGNTLTLKKPEVARLHALLGEALTDME